MIYSFDIFDTCLCRVCGEPKLVFDILAQRLMGNAGMTILNEFRYSRIEAEKLARKISSTGEVTIADIYNYFDTSAFGLEKNYVMESELLVEKELLCPIYKTLSEVRKIHNSGKVVLYISDMYLPSYFLKSILENLGFWKDGDSIFVSCEYGKSKSKGTLYDYVRSQVESLIWRHTGDNRNSDYFVPMKKGILPHCVKYEYSNYQKYVRELSNNPFDRRLIISAGISRCLVLQNDASPQVKFASDIIAPIYVPFVYRVLSDASKRGIQRLYFLARDGYIFCKIAECFKHLFPFIEIHYLYVSRKSLYLPSLKEISKDALKGLSVGISKNNLKEYLDNLQITLSCKEYEEASKHDNPLDYLWELQSFQTVIQKQWRDQKELCIAYFKQVGLASKEECAIVDLRGSRRSQVCINDILSENKYRRVYAYYLEVTSNRVKFSRNDLYSAEFCDETVGELELLKGLSQAKYLLEHYFSVTPFQRTSGYKLNGSLQVSPIFDEDEIIGEKAKSTCEINIKCCQEYARWLINLNLLEVSDKILHGGLSCLSSFIQNPNRVYLHALSGIYMSQTKYHYRKLVGFLTPFNFYKKSVIWYEGSIKLTYGGVGLYIYNKILKKCLVKILALM